MPKATLKSIASILGISVSTVSKAIKNYPDISEDTKASVMKLVKKMEYKPNSIAQSLRSQKSNIIGIITPVIVHHFFANIIQAVIDSAAKKNYLVIVLQSNESYEIEKQQMELLIDKNVDGILLSLSENTVNYKHINKIIEKGMPVVLYDKISKLVNCSRVIIDDIKASYNATEHLIKTGCRKIAHIRGNLKPQTTIDRFMGYRRAMEASDIKYDKSLVYTSENLSYEDGKELVKKIMKEHPDVDGIFVFTDLVATGVLKGLHELNISVPNQVSVVGFSNWFLTNITTPTLTTIDQPGYKMGEEAFKLLYNEITENAISSKKTVVIPTNLIKRNSTR